MTKTKSKFLASAARPRRGPRASFKRKPDGAFVVNLGGELVNRQHLAKLLHTTPERISQWTKLPDGLPFLRIPSGDPHRNGLRMMFDLAKVREWLDKRIENTASAKPSKY